MVLSCQHESARAIQNRAERVDELSARFGAVPLADLPRLAAIAPRRHAFRGAERVAAVSTARRHLEPADDEPAMKRGTPGREHGQHFPQHGERAALGFRRRRAD
jgi:hypothetical protein